MIYFICGCDSKIDPPIDRELLKTFDSVVFDDEGFLVCLLHRQRIYGWRSVPYQAGKVPPGVNASYTPLEWERFRIFGEITRQPRIQINAYGQDRRDNRDPEFVGLKILSDRNGHK